MGPTRDFMDAPTQFGSAALRFAPTTSLKWGLGYRITSVEGSRFYNDARDVAGSLNSTWQSPYINVAYINRCAICWGA